MPSGLTAVDSSVAMYVPGRGRVGCEQAAVGRAHTHKAHTIRMHIHMQLLTEHTRLAEAGGCVRVYARVWYKHVYGTRTCMVLYIHTPGRG